MKDALGHGSDSHSQGVQDIGRNRSLRWDERHGSHFLIDAKTGYPAVAIISRLAGGKYTFRATHEGDATDHKSVVSAKKWVANRVANGSIVK